MWTWKDIFVKFIQKVSERVIVVQCQLSNFQLYHGENKLIFNEMMLRSAMY